MSLICFNCRKSESENANFKLYREADHDYCCSGSECGCMGMPIDPPLCDKCEEVIGNILNYIKKCDYTYSNLDIIEGYKKKINGYYVSYTMNDCIDNLKEELEYLINVENSQ